MDPKILAGAAILGGGGLLYFLSNRAVEGGPMTPEERQEMNKEKWTNYSEEMQGKIADKETKLWNELSIADPKEKEQLINQLEQNHVQQYQLNQQNANMTSYFNSGGGTGGALFGPSKQDTFAQVQKSPALALAVYKTTGTYDALKNQATTEKYMNPIFSDEYNKIWKREAEAQTHLDLLTKNADPTLDPKKAAQMRTKYQQELDKMQRQQAELDARKKAYDDALAAGAYNKTIPQVAQYQRNQAAGKTQASNIMGPVQGVLKRVVMPGVGGVTK